MCWKTEGFLPLLPTSNLGHLLGYQGPKSCPIKASAQWNIGVTQSGAEGPAVLLLPSCEGQGRTVDLPWCCWEGQAGYTTCSIDEHFQQGPFASLLSPGLSAAHGFRYRWALTEAVQWILGEVQLGGILHMPGQIFLWAGGAANINCSCRFCLWKIQSAFKVQPDKWLR